MDSPNQKLHQGYTLLSQGHTAEALALATTLTAAHPTNADVLAFATEAHLANGDPRAALQSADQAVAASDGQPALKLMKARVLMHLRRRSEVAELALEVAAQAGKDDSLIRQAGKLLGSCNRLDEAIAQYERARGLVGDQPDLLYQLAVARFFNGDFEQAERDLDKQLRIKPRAGHALYRRATLRTQTRERNHVADIERILVAGFREPAHEAWAQYALGKELEDLGEHEKAFAAFTAGARKLRGTLRYDVADEVAALRAVCEAWTKQVMARPDAGCNDEGAIFIVGMPRTGTTLVERLLVQSGKVRSSGELPDFGNLFGTAAWALVADDPASPSSAQASTGIDFAALGRDYMRGAREAANGSARFIDKTPFNFLYCGPIRKALPHARIIHLTRHPLDCCYAVYKTLFYSAYNFSYDLDELAEYYIAYHETMRHWHEVMPGQILDIRYEDLVNDTENQTRRIYEWCGLEWNPQVLVAPIDKVAFKTASAAQVREPVHRRSVNSADRHRERLAPLIRKLAASGILTEE